MRTEIATLILIFSSVSCSAPEILGMPTVPDALSKWSTFSLSLVPESKCPNMAGEYSEPPLIYRSGTDARYTPSDNFDLYSSYIPFHLGERRELGANDLGLARDHFVIRQPDLDQFYFVYLNEDAKALVEYHFRSTEGDFECQDGYIEFPNYSAYGMIEGGTVNFQIRNIVAKDDGGSLVIQSTRGPFLGNSTRTTDEFTYEFFLYPNVDEMAKTSQ